MDQPLGQAVGNALEVREALDTVRGHGPPDFTELVLDACGKLLALSDLGIDEPEGRRRAEAAVATGRAETVWRRWIEAQGGTSDESALPIAPVIREVTAPRPGTSASWARSASATPPCISARAGAPRTTTSITPSASSAARSAERRSRRATCSPRCTRAPSAQADEAMRATCWPPTSSPTSRRPSGRSCSRSSLNDPAIGYREDMPELPEVETVRRGSRLCSRAPLRRVEITDARLTRPLDPVEVARELEGERVALVDRRGKYLIVRFESGRALLVHLRMTGSLLHGGGDSCRTILTAALLSG